MRIKIICVGKITQTFFKEAVAEYANRLSHYCKIKIIEVKDESVPEGINEMQKFKIKEIEQQRIQKHLEKSEYVIALDLSGKQMDSVAFSDFLTRKSDLGIVNITFIIGGSIGLSALIVKSANLVLSFSKMTFPHQLMRVNLLEQLYRTQRIKAGEPYHK